MSIQYGGEKGICPTSIESLHWWVGIPLAHTGTKAQQMHAGPVKSSGGAWDGWWWWVAWVRIRARIDAVRIMPGGGALFCGNEVTIMLYSLPHLATPLGSTWICVSREADIGQWGGAYQEVREMCHFHHPTIGCKVCLHQAADLMQMVGDRIGT